ncbi:MAG TPA: helicase-related protein, partial [Ktedonobacteraceae bacterium]
DITGIDQVINYELPESSDLFTHRVGRTGRMGRQGKAITLLVPSDVPKWRRMARSLGQAVTLLRLALDEEAMATIPGPRSEASVIQEHGQNGEQRPVRSRDHFSSSQERSRRVRPKQDSYTATDMKRQQKERVTNNIPAWQSESLPLSEHPYSGKARDGKRAAGKQSSSARTTGGRKAHAFAEIEPQGRRARRKSRVAPAGRGRRASVSNRTAKR